MKLKVNGEDTTVQGIQSVADLLAFLKILGPVAVLLNDDIVPRAKWPVQKLQEGDRVELLTFAGGG